MFFRHRCRCLASLVLVVSACLVGFAGLAAEPASPVTPLDVPTLLASPASPESFAFPPGVLLPDELFVIPASPPQTIITAEMLTMASGVATLEGRVRAVREAVITEPPSPASGVPPLPGRDPEVRQSDLLTAGRARLGQNPDWMLASLTPRLFRKETIMEKHLVRESTLDAAAILWNSTTGELDASDSVVVKIEERTWDLGTYSWVIISADAMRGHRDRHTLTFHGNVRLKDKTRFGQGDHLDYFKASSTVVLTGNARVEGEEWSEKNKRMEKRTIDGQRIEYHLDTKAMQSE